ncbi:MAG: hypothetical protein R3C56_25365 [Pirellulaceae bacterium]
MKTGPYRLLPIADSLQFAMDEPIFHPVLLSEAKYPESQFPEGGLATVATTAFLAARHDAPPVLVQTVLERIFAPEFVEQNGILSAERASHWSGHAWHPIPRILSILPRQLSIGPMKIGNAHSRSPTYSGSLGASSRVIG